MAKQKDDDRAPAEWVAVDDLVPWDRNPRINDPAVAAVADSIRRYGFGAPIVARLADRTIIAGHTRVKAARTLGLDRVPVRFLDVTVEQAHELALVDNKTGEIAMWDDEALSAIVRDCDIDLAALGWTAEDAARLSMTLDDVALDGPTWTAEPEVARVRFEVVVDPGNDAEAVRAVLRTIRSEAPSAVVRVIP